MTEAPLRHPEILRHLSLEEKAALTSGANFWNTESVEHAGVPSIMLTDGPHGVRKQGGKADHLGLNDSLPATCFPTAAALAQSWDPELLEETGRRLGAEARGAGVAVLLGPGLNIVRNPLGGRSFEYFSEDPRLSGELASGMVRGIQSNGIAACPKHFAVNSQEHLRMSIDEVVDERSLREIYLEGFRRVVEQAAPRTIMTSYNKVNGTYAAEHPQLLTDILKGEWGFDGVVVTDWGGNHDRVAGLKAGTQLEMPSSGGITDRQIVDAVRTGRLDQSVLDRAVDDLVSLALTTSEALDGATPVDPDAQHRFAIEAARRSIVLLRNEPAADGGPLLPLRPTARVAVIGDFARRPRYQGAGSSLVNPTRVDDALSALQDSEIEVIGYARGFHRFGRPSRRLAEEALALASRADTAVLFLGLDESSEAEGVDREHLRLPDNQLALVERLTGAHDRVVVVLAGGAPVELPFADRVAAIVHTSLAGQGGGTAVADVLSGGRNPGGRLAVTFPRRYEDVPSARSVATAGTYPGPERTAEHRDGIFVGYRYYTTRGVPVRFCFGHGLSYTSFEYTDLEVELRPDGGSAAFTLRNTGDRSGREVAQVYTGPADPAMPHARRQLAGFIAVDLEPGEARRLEIALDRRAAEYFDAEAERWHCPGGRYVVEVGASVEDIRLAATVEVEPGGDLPNPPGEVATAAYGAGDVQRVDDAEFAAMLRRPIPPWQWHADAPLEIDDPVVRLRHANLLGRGVLKALKALRRVLQACRRPHAANNVMFVVNMPFVKLEGFTAGRVSRRSIERFLRRVDRAPAARRRGGR